MFFLFYRSILPVPNSVGSQSSPIMASLHQNDLKVVPRKHSRHNHWTGKLLSQGMSLNDATQAVSGGWPFYDPKAKFVMRVRKWSSFVTSFTLVLYPIMIRY